jgi:hypothetical protein
MKLDYNICLVNYPNYIHHLAWWELGELICYSLRNLGYKTAIQNKKMEKGCRNILLGAFLLDPEFIPKIPADTIIINTEQIYLDDQKQNWPSDIYEWARKFETWDYSDKNIEKFQMEGISGVKKLQIGYQHELRRIPKNAYQDIDVLFYGSTNERRLAIINQLKERGLNVEVLFGVYGDERDKIISRSKVILNCHNYSSQIFEIVRCFYLMTNSKAIVTEVNVGTSIDAIYRDGLCMAPYESLVDACIKVVNDECYRNKLEERALNTISQYPQATFMSELILSAN